MFEIWGCLKNKTDNRTERIQKYLTKAFESPEQVPFVPPNYDLWKEQIQNMDFAVVTFRYFRYQNAPYVTLPQLRQVFSDFAPVKEKILLELSAMGTDYNLAKDLSIPLTANQAALKASVKSCPIFFSEETGASYFTYQNTDAHLVWFEDTKSLSFKHNLIKQNGFKGIYWENPYALTEGNWESLYEIWQKRTRC